MKPVSRKPGMGCQILIFFGVIALLTLFGALTWLDQPDRKTYEPIPTGQETPIGNRMAVTLPNGWKKREMQTFSGPQGETLQVMHASARILNMMPRTFTGQRIESEYTAIAYSNSVRKRMPHGAEQVSWNYVTLGEREGAEAVVHLSGNEYARGFVIVNQSMQATELLFQIPGGMDSKGWNDAEMIFRSLRTATPVQTLVEESQDLPQRKRVSKQAPQSAPESER